MIIFIQAKLIYETEMYQSSLSKIIVEFYNKSRPRVLERKDKKNTYDSAYALYEGRELTLNAFKSEIFPVKQTYGKERPSYLDMRWTILTPKQIYQRLPIALAQVKAGNRSENLLNYIRQTYILCIEQKKSLKRCI